MLVINQLIAAAIIGITISVSYILSLYIFSVGVGALVEFFCNPVGYKTFFQQVKGSRDYCSFWHHVGNGFIATTSLFMILFILTMVGAYAIDIFNCL